MNSFDKNFFLKEQNLIIFEQLMKSLKINGFRFLIDEV